MAIEKVREYFKTQGMEDRIQEFDRFQILHNDIRLHYSNTLPTNLNIVQNTNYSLHHMNMKHFPHQENLSAHSLPFGFLFCHIHNMNQHL